MNIGNVFSIISLCGLCACANESSVDAPQLIDQDASAPPTATVNAEITDGNDTDGNRQTRSADFHYDYELLREKIYVNSATVIEIKQALTEDDPYALSNTIHALYTMRWHRGIHNLLNDLWANNTEKHPALAWQHITKPPARIALASTINRNQIVGTDEQLAYIRSYQDHEHEFTRAQTVIALGFNGDPADIEYVKTMVNGDNHYVAQTAITSLALMGGNQARDAMIELWEQNSENNKGKLLADLLEKYYDWLKPVTNTENEQQ